MIEQIQIFFSSIVRDIWNGIQSLGIVEILLLTMFSIAIAAYFFFEHNRKSKPMIVDLGQHTWLIK